jgi:hypothetical protein
MTKPALPVPIYSIFDRDIPRAHLHACVIVNPIGPAEDRREAHETIVAGCESASCLIGATDDKKGPVPGSQCSAPDLSVTGPMVSRCT